MLSGLLAYFKFVLTMKTWFTVVCNKLGRVSRVTITIQKKIHSFRNLRAKFELVLRNLNVFVYLPGYWMSYSSLGKLLIFWTSCSCFGQVTHVLNKLLLSNKKSDDCVNRHVTFYCWTPLQVFLFHTIEFILVCFNILLPYK